MNIDRRQFLKWLGSAGMGILSADLIYLGLQQNVEKSAPSTSLVVPEWTGDSFGPMHRIRDKEAIPISQPSRDVDVVIIGGGLSGLTAAYKLRDENFLLLEREDQLGGNAKQGKYRGIVYALGSAYLVDVGPPYAQFYEELALPLKPLPEPTDMAKLKGQWQSLESSAVSKPFLKLKEKFSKLLLSRDFPSIPIKEASTAALGLDKISFYDYLQSDVTPELMGYIDAYCYSALGGSVREISAYAGVNFYSEIAGDIYTFPGGNAYVAQRLIQQIAQAGASRLNTGVSVYRIKQENGKVLTSFFYNHQPDQVETVASKAVIMATPYFFTPYILEDLKDTEKARLQSLKYGSYLVANCCFDRPVFQGGYDNWTPSNPVFTDFVDAGYVNLSYTERQEHSAAATVLTVYAPFRDPLAGRAALLQGNRVQFAEKISKQLQKSVGYPAQHLKEVRLTRYGHQMLSSRVGIIHTLANLKKKMGRVILAHSDGQGMACIESAVWEGLEAAKAVKPLLLSARESLVV